MLKNAPSISTTIREDENSRIFKSDRLNRFHYPTMKAIQETVLSDPAIFCSCPGHHVIMTFITIGLFCYTLTIYYENFSMSAQSILT